ncbi:hypothetical protein D1BOALGB6SA_2775 [Olavius sp. associated proteobacterium Delta 1]|nr:hypothetical protein D1BOALGB6SA_2775 [Olavius sp. associated proteobacterium Delta 1]
MELLEILLQNNLAIFCLLILILAFLALLYAIVITFWRCKVKICICKKDGIVIETKPNILYQVQSPNESLNWSI